MSLELATVEDLQDALPDVGDGVARSAIRRSSALVRAVARQTFDFVTDDVVVLTGGERDLVLPERPVFVDATHPLSVVELDDLQVSEVPAVEGQGFSRVGERLVKRHRSMYQPGVSLQPFAGLYGQSWPLGIWAPFVRVTYSHGYLSPPEWLTAIVLNAATVYATNPESLYSEQVGGITLTWQRASVTAKASLVNQIRDELSAVGIRRGGAFSIGTY